MKAKEYFHRIEKANYNTDAIIQDVIHPMLNEMKELSESRGCITTASIMACVREMNQKWLAICRMSEGKLPTKSFLLAMVVVSPSMESLLIHHGLVEEGELKVNRP